jgi:hypothetical protein
MNCRDLEELLSAYADGELSRTQREFIEEHLSSCADCRATLAEFEAAGRQLASLRETPAVPDISKSTLSKIKATSQLPRKLVSRWLRPVTAVVSIVAVIAVMLVAQPWRMESSEAMAASIVRNSPEVRASLNGEEIEEVEVTTKIVDEENNVLMVLVRTEERAIAAEVNLETKKVTEIVRVEVPDFQPGDEQKAIDIASADPRVQEILAQGRTISEVHLGYSLAGETVIPTALLTIEQDKYDWNISVDLQKSEVASIGRSQPSAAMIVVHISRFVTRFVAPVLLFLGILLVSGLSFGYRRAKTIAGTAALALGIIGLFMALYSLSSIWWRLVLLVGIPVVGLIIGIADLRQRGRRRWMPITGIVLGSLALLLVFLNAIMLNINNVPGESVVRVIAMAVIIASIIAYAFKERIMSIRISGRLLRPVAIVLAAVVVLIVALVQPWSVNPEGVIARAYSATEGLLSYRMSYNSLKTTYSNETEELTFESEFVAPDRYYLKMIEDGEEFEAILSGSRLFVKSNSTSKNTVYALVVSSSSFLNKEITMKMLDSLTDLEGLPDEQIDGTECFHYRGRVDMESQMYELEASLDPSDSAYANMLEEIEKMRNMKNNVELWIGKDDYLIRQNVQSYQLPADESGQWDNYNLAVKNYDFNKPITIELPLTSTGELLPGWEEVINSTFSRPVFSSGHSISVIDDEENPARKKINYRFFVRYTDIGEAKNVRVTVTTMFTNEVSKPAIIELEPSQPGPIDLKQHEQETFTASWEYDASVESMSREDLDRLLNSSIVMVSYTTPYGEEKEVQLYPEEPPYPTKTPPPTPPAD